MEYRPLGKREIRSSSITCVILVVVSIWVVGCSSASNTGDPWVIQYVGSSDNTWTAIHIALIDLDYTVEKEDRNEGRIRAVREAEDGRAGSVLVIDQMAQHDMVNVYVKVEAVPGEPALDRAQREVFANEFVDPVKQLLFK